MPRHSMFSDPYYGLCSAPPATFKYPQLQVPRIVPLQRQQSPCKSPRFPLCFPLIMAPPTYIMRVPPELLLNSIRARPFDAGATTIRSLLQEFSFFQASLHKFALSSVCLKLNFLISHITAVEPPGLPWASGFLNLLTFSKEHLIRVRWASKI